MPAHEADATEGELATLADAEAVRRVGRDAVGGLGLGILLMLTIAFLFAGRLGHVVAGEVGWDRRVLRTSGSALAPRPRAVNRRLVGLKPLLALHLHVSPDHTLLDPDREKIPWMQCALVPPLPLPAILRLLPTVRRQTPYPSHITLGNCIVVVVLQALLAVDVTALRKLEARRALLRLQADAAIVSAGVEHAQRRRNIELDQLLLCFRRED